MNWLTKLAAVRFQVADASKISQPKSVYWIGVLMNRWAVDHEPRYLQGGRNGITVDSDGEYSDELVGIINWYVNGQADPNEALMYIKQCLTEELEPLGIKAYPKYPVQKSGMFKDTWVWRVEVIENRTANFTKLPSREVRTENCRILFNMLGIVDGPDGMIGRIDAQELLERIQEAYPKVEAYQVLPSQGSNWYDGGADKQYLTEALQDLQSIAQYAIANNFSEIEWQ